MMSDSQSDLDQPIITANAAMLRHSAKIGLFQMLSLIVGFAHGASILETAETAQVHRDTARDIFAALRDRLAKPRFKKWVQSAYASPHLSDDDDAAQMNEAKGALFLCHENTECQKRFFAGRRKSRVCRACPVLKYVTSHVPETERRKDDAAALIYALVDDLRDFYRDLGWNESVNSGTDARDIFDKRFRHFEIHSTAIGNSTFDEDGTITSTEDDFLSIPHLAKELTDELREEPLNDG